MIDDAASSVNAEFKPLFKGNGDDDDVDCVGKTCEDANDDVDGDEDE